MAGSPQSGVEVTEVAQARRLAEQLLARLSGGSSLLIPSDGAVIARPWGWVFFPVSKRFAETKNPGDLIPGVGPIAVERRGGHAEMLPPAPTDAAIVAFEQRRAQFFSARPVQQPLVQASGAVPPTARVNGRLPLQVAYTGLTPITLTIGQSVTAPLALRFISVVQDHRAPGGITSNNAGRASVLVQARGVSQELTIPGKAYFGDFKFGSTWDFVPMPASTENCLVAGEHVVCFVDLEPYPFGQTPVDPARYRGRFFVDTLRGRIAREQALQLSEAAIRRALHPGEDPDGHYVTGFRIADAGHHYVLSFSETKTHARRFDVDVQLDTMAAHVERIP